MLQPLQTVSLSTPLTTALSLLLEAGVSCLPVVDEKRQLLDVYARSDITQLCKGNAYNRLQWEDVTVRTRARWQGQTGGLADKQRQRERERERAPPPDLPGPFSASAMQCLPVPAVQCSYKCVLITSCEQTTETCHLNP